LVLAPLALAALYAGTWSFALLVAVFLAVGAWEWLKLCGSSLIFLAVGLLILAAAGAALIWVQQNSDTEAVLWLFGVVWATDIGAYTVGSLARGPRIAPTISPNKTWAGLGGGIVFAVAWSLVWGCYFVAPEAYFLDLIIGLAAAGAVVAQMGDFALSFAKRRFGRKDSSGLIPGHGGVLDRIAGLLTTGPALALLLQFEAIMNVTNRLTGS
jgi:phosphatidate cytidylyltransferase